MAMLLSERSRLKYEKHLPRHLRSGRIERQKLAAVLGEMHRSLLKKLLFATLERCVYFVIHRTILTSAIIKRKRNGEHVARCHKARSIRRNDKLRSNLALAGCAPRSLLAVGNYGHTNTTSKFRQAKFCLTLAVNYIHLTAPESKRLKATRLNRAYAPQETGIAPASRLKPIYKKLIFARKWQKTIIEIIKHPEAFAALLEFAIRIRGLFIRKHHNRFIDHGHNRLLGSRCFKIHSHA